MSLLLWQELYNENIESLKKARRYTLGEFKQINFLINKSGNLTEEQEKLLTAWSNGERTEEDADHENEEKSIAFGDNTNPWAEDEDVK